MRRCPFTNCGQRIPAERFCCRPHWYSLNKEQRDEIWAAYRAWLRGVIDGQALRARQQLVLGTRGTA